jgi:hypothetical protein
MDGQCSCSWCTTQAKPWISGVLSYHLRAIIAATVPWGVALPSQWLPVTAHLMLWPNGITNANYAKLIGYAVIWTPISTRKTRNHHIHINL